MARKAPAMSLSASRMLRSGLGAHHDHAAMVALRKRGLVDAVRTQAGYRLVLTPAGREALDAACTRELVAETQPGTHPAFWTAAGGNFGAWGRPAFVCAWVTAPTSPMPVTEAEAEAFTRWAEKLPGWAVPGGFAVVVRPRSRVVGPIG